MQIDVIKSILAINPNAVVSVSGDDVNQIQWLENTPVIDSATILAKQSELQILEDVISKRINGYGSIAVQIEYITENGLDAWQSKVAEIKTKYPKV